MLAAREAGAASRLKATGAIALAVLVVWVWPVTAYALHPLLVPGVIAVGAVVLVVPWRSEHGIALALAIVPFLSYRPALANAVLSRPVLALALPALGFGLALYGLYAPARGRFSSGWLAIAMLGLLAACVVSALQGLDARASVRSVFVLATATALTFAVMQLCHDRRQLMVIAAGAVVGLALASGQGIYQHYVSSDLFGFYSDGSIVTRIQGSFVHPNTYGGYLATLIPIAAGLLAARPAPPALRWLGAGALTLAVPALALSYSRGAMVGLAVGSFVWLARWRPRAAVATAVVVAAGAFAFAPATLRDRFNSASSGEDVGVRSEVWAGAVRVYEQHPLLGAGPANFPRAYATLASTATPASERPLLNHGTGVALPYHAHNLLLSVLADEGALGLAAFLALLAVCLSLIYRGCQVRDPAARTICLGIGAGWMAWLVSSMVDAAFFNEFSFPLLALAAVAAGFVALDRRDADAA